MATNEGETNSTMVDPNSNTKAPEKESLPPRPKRNTDSNSKRKSMVWSHFTEIKNGNTKKPRASCNYCGATYACDAKINGTRNMLAHIHGQCQKYPYKTEDLKQKALTFQPKKGEEGESGSSLIAVGYSHEKCRQALAEMVIIDELPFKFVEGIGFRRFMGVAQPRFTNIPCRTTIARDCLKLFVEEKKKLKSLLRGHKICITTDTWSSIQNINYMCLTAHFIDNEWKLHKKILNFCQVQSHKGEVLGKVIESCLLDWGIDSIYTTTVDNASSNNGTIQYLKRKTKNWKGTILEHEFLHIRCCAHILNLIVRDGLKEMDESIVKVRNAVRYVKSSPARKAKFKMCIDKEKIESKSLLCLDVPTRWNSTYMMLEVAEKFEKAFERLEEDDPHFLYYFGDEECDGNDDDDDDFEDGNGIGRGKGKGRRKILGPPDSLDWSKTRTFVKFLKLFYNATLRFSGSLYITSNSFFHEVVLIKNKLRQLINNGDYLVSSMAKNMIGKFDKYWSLEKVNVLLYIAVMLDPRFKLKYVAYWFGQLYDDDVANDMTRNVKDTLIRLYGWYGDNNSSSSASHNLDQPSDTAIEIGVDEDDDIDGRAFLASQFKRHLEAEDSVGVKSEVERYLVESCEDWIRSSSSPINLRESMEEVEKLAKVEEDVLGSSTQSSIVD